MWMYRPIRCGDDDHALSISYMQIRIKLEAIATLLNFLGTCVLALDAVTAPRRARIRYGEELAKMFEKSNPQRPDRLELWFAGISFRIALLGLGLIAVGFLVDLYAKITAPNPTLFHSAP